MKAKTKTTKPKDEAQVIARLHQLARTKTQAEAARAVKLTRYRVGQIAEEHGIQFAEVLQLPRAPYCSRCRFRLSDYEALCLRCKWTPKRIKQLRNRLNLSQVRMSYEVLRMNVWVVQRWESGNVRPGHAGLERLEQVEQALDNRALQRFRTRRSRPAVSIPK